MILSIDCSTRRSTCHSISHPVSRSIFRSINHTLGVIAFLVLAAITSAAQKPELVVQTGHSGDVAAVAFSPDGKMLASGGRTTRFALGGFDRLQLDFHQFLSRRDGSIQS